MVDYTDNEEAVLRALKRGPKSTLQIASATALTTEQMSVQLRRMRKKGLIEVVRKGSYATGGYVWQSLVEL